MKPFLTIVSVAVQSPPMSVAPELLDLLTCPRCRSRVQLTPGKDGLACSRCRVTYPITDDIPVMISEEAVPWTSGPDRGPDHA
jgi:hypothetical protein